MDAREKLVELSDIQVLQREIECVKRKSATNCADCLNCDLLMTDERILSAYANAIDALQNANGVTVQELDGCKYCKEYEDLPEHFIDGEPVGRVFDTCIQTNENGLWHIEVPCGADIGIRFCPMCGRRLPQPPKGE